MSKWFAERARDQKGFTLIEIMVVVAILAILAFLALPKVLEALDKSKLNSAISIANELASGLERYAAKNGEASVVQYPTDANFNDDWATMVAFLETNDVVTLPDAAAAGKYFDVTTLNYTGLDIASGVPGDYTLQITTTSRSGQILCVKPGGVKLGAC